MIQLRLARLEDASQIAGVHVAAWREAYQGILTPETLAALQKEERLELWNTVLAGPSPWRVVFVVEVWGEVVGFASGGDVRGVAGETEDGELHALYLLKAHQGKGLGAALLRAVAVKLAKLGKTSLCAWVLEDNAQARGFYEAQGGRAEGCKVVEIGERPYQELRYVWSCEALTGESVPVFETYEGMPPETVLAEVLALHQQILGARPGESIRGEMIRHQGDLLVQIARVDGKVVAFKMGYVDRAWRFHSWMGGVHPAYRRRGLAASLMQAQHRWCAARHIGRVRTVTTHQWQGMLMLNLQCGFQIIGTRHSGGQTRIELERRIPLPVDDA